MELNPAVEGAEEFKDITKEPGFVMTPVGGVVLGLPVFTCGSELKVTATGGTFRIF